MSFSLQIVLLIFSCLAALIECFPISVAPDSTTINAVTPYLIGINFTGSVARSYIALQFPSVVSLTGIIVSQNGVNLTAANFNITGQTVYRLNPPNAANFTYIIYGVTNSPYVIQGTFNVITNITTELVDSVQFITYTPGNLQACLWTFAKYTGSSNSSVDITLVLTNALLLSNLSFSIKFSTYPDSNNSQYLTIGSTTTAQYSLTGSVSDLASISSLSATGVSISFNVNQTGTLVQGNTILIRLSGIQNPPTENTANTVFSVTTNQLFNSSYVVVDQSNGCSVTTLAVQQYTASFDQNNALQINTNYKNAKITISATVPYIILTSDTLQMSYNTGMIFGSASPLSIQFTRHDTLIFNQLNNGTNGTKYFNATLSNNYTAQTSSILTFSFNITTPPSQTPWTFTFIFKRSSGGYFQVTATLVALPAAFSANAVNFTASTNQMSIQNTYTVSFLIGQAISGAGKLQMTFDPDFGFNTFSNSCTGIINSTSITSISSKCYIMNGTFYTICFQLGGLASDTISAGSTIVIQVNNVVNPLYPKSYNFSATSFYNLQSDSVVESGVNLQTLTYMTHYVTPSLDVNTFSVYQSASIQIIYTNDVPWPKNATVNISFPLAVSQFSFSNQITINGTLTNITLPNVVSNTTQKWISFNTVNIVSVGSNLLIPFNIVAPTITGTFLYTTITVTFNSIVYESCLSEPSMGIYVTSASSDASFSIFPILSTVNSVSMYKLLINSNVSHPSSFDIIVAIPIEISFVSQNNNVTAFCSAEGSICNSTIQNITSNKLNISILTNNWTSVNSYQIFSLNISFFKNQRSLQPSANWNFITQKYVNGVIQSIITNTCTSTVTTPATMTAYLNTASDYYRQNAQIVRLMISLSSSSISGDYLMLYFNTLETYSLNPLVSLACPLPLNTICSVSNQTIQTFYISVMLPSGLSSFQLNIQGLVSFSNSAYNVTKYIDTTRYNTGSYQIDNGQIGYSISCGNLSVASKVCRRCYINNTCRDCYSGTFLFNGACVTNCSITSNYSTFQNATSNQCDPCVYPCKTCSSDVSCNTCATDKVYYLLADYTCSLICNTSNGYWINPTNGIQCISCSSNCLTCANNSNTGCTKCNSTYFLYNGGCSAGSCPLAGQYADSVNSCFNCDISCLSCSGSGSSNCIICKASYKNSSGNCVSSCPSTQFTFPNNTCGCLADCLTCLASSSTFCTSCNSLGGLTYYSYKGVCYNTCPSQTFNNGDGTCAACISNCLICSDNISCSQCTPNNYLYSNKCYSDCNLISDQFDISQDGLSCYKCPTGCDTCALTACSTCLPTYTFEGSTCTLSCSLTGSCTVPSQVPDSIMPMPGTISVLIWVGIVIAMKLLVGKLYVSYSMVFMFSLIQFLLIIISAAYSNNLSNVVARLLATDYSYRSTIFALLIIALVLNYITNVLFMIVFIKYIKPLLSSPRQVDLITNGVVLFIGMVTNYRFCLLIFSKMFPKPQIPIQNSSKLTPVHYLCITSALLSVFALAAAGLILKNEYPLTDIFMLGIDLIIIQLLLFAFSIWMVAIDKDQDYYNNDIKKYNIEQMYRTQQGILDDQKNVSKANIRNQTDFQYLNDSIRFDKKINNDRISAVNLENQQVPSSDVQNQPLPKVSKMHNINLQALRVKPNPNQEDEELDITRIVDSHVKQSNSLQKKQKAGTRRKHSKMNEDNGLRNKSKQSAVNFGKDKNKHKSPQKKQQARNEKESQIEIDDLSSGQIPNLPLNNSVFHKKTSQEFGNKLPKPKLNSHRSTMLQKKKNSNFDNLSQKKVDMKKKNKLFQSDAGESNIEQMDIDAIIQSKIIMTKTQKVGEISSIYKKQDQEEFNQQISPSWFNIQNQRYQFSQNDSDNP